MSNQTVTKDFIQGLPKAELHLHLEGTLEPELKLRLAQKNKIDIGQSTIEEVRATYQFDSLTSFLQIYYPAMNVLQDEDDFCALAMDYLQKAKNHNVKYAELFFDPQAHTSRGIPFETVIGGYHKATVQALEMGVEAHLIMCFLRDMPTESALETYRQALPHRDKILGIGLASDERNNPALVDYVKKHNIPLTCCPVSNSFVVDDMKGKEMLELLHQGIVITVNSDDPSYFQSYISDDLYALAEKYDLSREDVIQIAKNSFTAAWIPQEKKQLYWDMIDRFTAAN